LNCSFRGMIFKKKICGLFAGKNIPCQSGFIIPITLFRNSFTDAAHLLGRQEVPFRFLPMNTRPIKGI